MVLLMERKAFVMAPSVDPHAVERIVRLGTETAHAFLECQRLPGAASHLGNALGVQHFGVPQLFGDSESVHQQLGVRA